MTTACSTTRQEDTEERKRLESNSAELLARIKQLAGSREQWFAELEEFLKKAFGLSREVTLLKNHPGWADLERIVTAEPSIRHLEGVEAAVKKTNQGVDAWGKKWNAPGKSIYGTYLALVDRGQTIEAERFDLANRWETLSREWMNAWSSFYLNSIMLRLGKPSEFKYWSELRESDRKRHIEEASIYRSILNSFGVDPSRLYITPTVERLQQMFRP